MAAPFGPSFSPRSYQYDPLRELVTMERRRHYWVWHRQAGKDRTAISGSVQVGFNLGAFNIFHCLPKYEQARTAIWENIDAVTHRRILDDVMPWVERPNNQDMTLTFKNGMLYRLVGSDNYHRLVGAGPFIVIFSEWSRCDPAAWAYFEPMLLRNRGIAIFITTPFGRNHAYEMFETNRDNPDWFVDLLTVDQTLQDAPGEDGQRIIKPEDIEAVRRAGRSEEYIQQEYFCSWAGVMEGSYYGQLIDEAEKQGRICDLPISKSVPVDTYWDLGRNDTTEIWFVQADGPWFNVIDYLSAANVGVEWYAKALQDKEYVYRSHTWPHDGAQKHFGAQDTRYDLGSRLLKPAPIILRVGKIQDGISAVRAILPRCRFDMVRCARGLEGLRGYHHEYDEAGKRFLDNPAHTWHSNPADAFRTFATRAQGAEKGQRTTQAPRSSYGGPRGYLVR